MKLYNEIDNCSVESLAAPIKVKDVKYPLNELLYSHFETLKAYEHLMAPARFINFYQYANIVHNIEDLPFLTKLKIFKNLNRYEKLARNPANSYSFYFAPIMSLGFTFFVYKRFGKFIRRKIIYFSQLWVASGIFFYLTSYFTLKNIFLARSLKKRNIDLDYIFGEKDNLNENNNKHFQIIKNQINSTSNLKIISKPSRLETEEAEIENRFKPKEISYTIYNKMKCFITYKNIRRKLTKIMRNSLLNELNKVTTFYNMINTHMLHMSVKSVESLLFYKYIYSYLLILSNLNISSQKSPPNTEKQKIFFNTGEKNSPIEKSLIQLRRIYILSIGSENLSRSLYSIFLFNNLNLQMDEVQRQLFEVSIYLSHFSELRFQKNLLKANLFLDALQNEKESVNLIDHLNSSKNWKYKNIYRITIKELSILKSNFCSYDFYDNNRYTYFHFVLTNTLLLNYSLFYFLNLFK
jgi:hypothetical protein